MRDWTANYEISDFVRQDKTNKGRVTFFRYNQWPERGAAKYEEAERMVEEKPFGGEEEGDKSKVPLKEGD